MATPTTMSSSAASRSVSKGERFNKLPLIIVGFVVALFAFGLYYAAMSRVEPPRTFDGVSSNLEASNTSQDYQSIEFLEGRKDGLVNAIAPESAIAAVEETDRQSDLADQIAAMIEKQRLAEYERTRKMQSQILQRQFELEQQAMEGNLDVRVFSDRRPSASVPETLVPGSASSFEAGVNPLSINGEGRPRSARRDASPNAQAASLSSTDPSGVIAGRDFVSEDHRDDFTLFEHVSAPLSQYQLTSGTLIPGVMISAASSELPGDLVAQVTQDVYDSVTGRYLLIPQGSKLFGRYDSFAALGSERLLMVWDRVILPDGEALTLGSIQGYDQRGMSGAKDRVITHFWKTLFNALLLSVATSAGDALVDESAKSGTIIADLSANFGTTTSSAFDDYLRARLRIKPTFEIRSGYRFNIIVNKDITFPEPFEFGYTRLEFR